MRIGVAFDLHGDLVARLVFGDRRDQRAFGRALGAAGRDPEVGVFDVFAGGESFDLGRDQV